MKFPMLAANITPFQIRKKIHSCTYFEEAGTSNVHTFKNSVLLGPYLGFDKELFIEKRKKQ